MEAKLKIIKIISDKVKSGEWNFEYECEEDEKGKIVIEFNLDNKKYKAYFDYELESINTSEEITENGYVGILTDGVDFLKLADLEIWEQRNGEDYGFEFEQIDVSEIQTEIGNLEI